MAGIKNINISFKNKTLRSYILTIIGSIIYSMAVVWLLQLGRFYASGVTGISQLVSYFVGEIGGKTISVGILIGIINLPLLLIGWRHIGRKFAYLSLVSIITQSIVIFLLEYFASHYGVQPFKVLMVEKGLMFNELGEIIYNPELILQPGNRLLLAIIGGGLAGIGTSLCLSAGGSTGGMDIVSNSLFMKKNISFTKYTFIVDAIIILAAWYVGLETMLYTFIRLITYVITIDYFYTIYKTAKIEVITEKAMDVRTMLLEKYHHGMTIYSVKGGYALQEKWMIKIFVSSYEINDYLNSIIECDPKAFISVSSVINIKGNYIKKTIV